MANEQEKYEVIKKLIENNGNKRRAACTLGCSNRTIDRYIAGYKRLGKAYFIHGNKGRKPIHTLDKEVKAQIVNLYLNKYYDANFTHFTQMLIQKENITVSQSSVRKILKDADIISGKANRKTKRDLKKRLKAKLEITKTKKKADEIRTHLVAAEEAHPRRPRCSKFGEMIQMDASLHLWFGDTKVTLHLAIDDATGMIVGAWFEQQETLKGYYHVFEQILKQYGIPYMFYTDKRTIFEYKKTGGTDTSKDTFTQFSYACKQLGVDIKTTSVPQAKGRIERLFQTVQSRLPVELRLEGVSTIEQANDYLPRFIETFNASFALKANFITSVFETQPPDDKIDLILAVITERTIDSGHSIRFENAFYRTLNKDGLPLYLQKGTKGLVIRTFSGDLFFCAQDDIFALDKIPTHEHISKNFDIKTVEQAPKKRHIPPPSHPWRLGVFSKFAQKQANLTA